MVECRCGGECRVDAPLFTVWISSIIYRVSTPSPSLMDGGVCSETERWGVEIGWRIASPRPPSATVADKESPLQFVALLVHTTGYQRYRGKSWIQRSGLEVGRISRGEREGCTQIITIPYSSRARHAEGRHIEKANGSQGDAVWSNLVQEAWWFERKPRGRRSS